MYDVTSLCMKHFIIYLFNKWKPIIKMMFETTNLYVKQNQKLKFFLSYQNFTAFQDSQEFRILYQLFLYFK